MTQRGHWHLLRPHRRPAQPQPRTSGNWFFVEFLVAFQLTIPNNPAGITTNLWFNWWALSEDFNPPDVQLGMDNLAAVWVNVIGDPQLEQGPFHAFPSALRGSDSRLGTTSSVSVSVNAGIATLNNIDVRIIGSGAATGSSGTITLSGSGQPGQATFLCDYAGDLFTDSGTWSPFFGPIAMTFSPA
jgi:hypothetical protein